MVGPEISNHGKIMGSQKSGEEEKQREKAADGWDPRIRPANGPFRWEYSVHTEYAKREQVPTQVCIVLGDSVSIFLAALLPLDDLPA